jgi:hypothetical protein
MIIPAGFCVHHQSQGKRLGPSSPIKYKDDKKEGTRLSILQIKPTEKLRMF